MKILYVTDVFPPRCGGSGWSVYFFARALRRHGHELKIVSLDGTSRSYDGFDVEAHFLSRSGFPFVHNWKREHRDVPRIAENLRRLLPKFDIAHAHHKFSSIALATAAGENFFVTIRDYWPICVCGRSQYRSGDVCSVYDFSRCSEEESPWKGIASPLVYPWFAGRLQERRMLLQSAKTIFCISRYLREQLHPFFGKKLEVLPNFAEEMESDAVPDVPAERYCLYVGRLERNKGAQLLPEVMKKSGVCLPLVLIGEGSLQNQLAEEFRLRGVQAHFLGYRQYPEMLAVLKKCNFVLFPSLWAEPLGRVLVEAGMMGKPVIAFAHPGGHHDIVRNKANGLLAGTPDEFAGAIANLASDSELRKQLGAEARTIYEQLFTPDIIIPQLLRRYELFRRTD